VVELIAMARCGWRISAIVPVLALAAVASGAEPIGVVTELNAKGGRIEVKSAGSDNWEIPRPLRSIRAGDHVRVSGTARAVIMLTGGSRTIVITATNSPFVIVAPSQSTFLDRTKSAVREGVEAVTGERKRTHIRAAIITARPTSVLERAESPSQHPTSATGTRAGTQGYAELCGKTKGRPDAGPRLLIRGSQVRLLPGAPP